MSLGLRQQLRTPAPRPETMPISAADDPPRCFSLRDGTLALTLLLRDRAAVSLPYAHFLYAELGEARVLLIWFATHRVLVHGRGLTPLFEEVAAQRLELLRELPPRIEPLVDGVWIDRIEVRRHKEPATPLSADALPAAARPPVPT